jgi:addiction module RelE/StbE family toxin
MEIIYTPSFIRQYKKLNKHLQEEVLEKIELFKNKDNHEKLKVHALKGRMSDCYSFSINYSHRMVFEYLTKSEALFLKVGDHSIYE